jgi:hypothetical protein
MLGSIIRYFGKIVRKRPHLESSNALTMLTSAFSG